MGVMVLPQILGHLSSLLNDMLFFYRPATTEVVMYCEASGNITDLPFLEVVPTAKQKMMMELNYEIYVRNGKLHFEIPPYIKNEEKQKRIEKTREDLVNATTFSELRKILLEIIKE